MKNENQVSSLVPSKQLKDLGVKQESIWVYVDTPRGYNLILNRPDSDIFKCSREQISAFTVAELGEMLAKYNKNRDFVVTNFDNEEDFEWICQIQRFDSDDYIGETFYAESEADARAKMLIYLIKNKLV
ncbi:TPA: hypothetical protein DIC62_01510 [Candidatus Nomurabacteria bacterium]|nr:hypothetical protein [Candidatus Nomurabacteria bacterium]